MNATPLEGCCECGCGERTNLARQDHPGHGWVKGRPLRFIKGHQNRGRRFPAEVRAKVAAAMTGPRNGSWKDGRYLSKDGYVYVWVGRADPMANSTGYVLEHRLVMARALGRPLRAEEVVHHLLECEGGSGDKADNRIENLRLFATPGEHTAHHQRLIKGALSSPLHA